MPFIGIDLANAALEPACRPRGETGMVPDDQGGFRDLGGAARRSRPPARAAVRD